MDDTTRREQKRISNAKYRRAHHFEILAGKERYRDKNQDKIRSYQKKYRLNHPSVKKPKEQVVRFQSTVPLPYRGSMLKSNNHNGNGHPARPMRRYDYAAIYRWLVAYKIQHDGNSPAYSDIMAAFGISSRSVVNAILGVMERGGYIERTRGARRSRNIEIVGATWVPPEQI